MKTFNFKSRKAVSTIIGTFFFVIIMAGTFAAFIIMMQTNSNFLNTQLGATQNEIEKIQGKFTIGAAYDKQTNSAGVTSNKLCVSVTNSGSTPLEIADLFIENKTDHNARQFDVDFRDAFVPASSIKQILANQPITLSAGTSGITYNIKVVTTSGIVQTTELKVFPNAGTGNDPRLNVTSFVYPTSAPSGQNVTVGMQVYNRANTTLINVQPNGEPIEAPDLAVSNGYRMVSPSNITRLDPNESGIFMWDPQFTGGVGSKINFTVRAKALVEGCTSGSNSYIFSSQMAQVLVVPGVKKQILASPEIFISFPNPFGKSGGSDRGLLSVVVQNPTTSDFTVTQVAMQVASPTAADIVSSIVGIIPSTTWTEDKGVIVWTGSVVVPAYGLKQFLVRAEPTNAPGDFPINIVTANVYSSFGQFSKGPLALGMYNNAETAIVNVYAKTTFSGHVETFAITSVDSGTIKRFDFTISNRGTASVTSGAYMMINIPPGLRNVTDVSTTAGTDGLSTGLQVFPLIEFADGSSQKPIKLTSALLTDTNRTYSMYANMPTISVPAHYTITIVANGTSAAAVTPAHQLGPFAEVVVQVCPTSIC